MAATTTTPLMTDVDTASAIVEFAAAAGEEARKFLAAAGTLAAMRRERRKNSIGVYVTADGKYLPRAPVSSRTRGRGVRRPREDEQVTTTTGGAAAADDDNDSFLSDVGDFWKHAPASEEPPLKRARCDEPLAVVSVGGPSWDDIELEPIDLALCLGICGADSPLFSV